MASEYLDESSIVPLGDIAFPCKGPEPEDPGKEGWAHLAFGPDKQVAIARERPAFWREYRHHRRREMPGGLLVCPDLV